MSIQQVERLTVVALVIILFDGGLHIGLGRFRRSGLIVALGVLGTFATAGLVAVAAHYLLGLDWIFAGLIGVAIAPTDPAVTFSVFGSREIRGRAGTILEGEAGVNDPVGIALMIGMIELATHDDAGFSIIVSEFAIEMALGLVVGIGGALALLPVMRHVRLTGPALYPIRVLAGAGIIYGLAAVVGGSGFLAAFVAGVLLGDAAAPRRARSRASSPPSPGWRRSQPSWRSGSRSASGASSPGRRGSTASCSRFCWHSSLARSRSFRSSFRRGSHAESASSSPGAGLKGAVPILLGALALLSDVDDAERLYGIVFIVVLFSVVVQGASVPMVARRLRIPFRRVDHDLAEVLEFVVRDDAFASGRRIADLPLGERAWVGVLIRDERPRAISGSVVLEPGDRVHVYCQPEDAAALERIFAGTSG